MNIPMVSVIVPVYNAEATIKKCVDSILSNHYQALEVILVNDGSTDNSGRICDELAVNDIRVQVIHKKNEGVGAARNTGLESVTGQYVMFADADDAVSDSMYEKMVERAAFTDADCVVCNAVYIYTDRRVTERHVFGNQLIQGPDVGTKIVQPLVTPGHDDASLMQSACNKLYRTSVIRNSSIRFSRLPYAEDWLFNIEFFLNAEKVAFIEDALYLYNRETLGSLSKSYRKTAFQDTVWIQNRLAQLFPEKYTPEDLRLGVLGIQVDCLNNYAYYRGIKGFCCYASELFCDEEIARAYKKIEDLPGKYRWPGKCVQHGWRKRYCLWCVYAAKTTLLKHEVKNAYCKFRKSLLK